MLVVFLIKNEGISLTPGGGGEGGEEESVGWRDRGVCGRRVCPEGVIGVSFERHGRGCSVAGVVVYPAEGAGVLG